MTKSIKNQAKRQPIRPLLKTLELFKTISFPLSRVTVVRATIHTLQTEKGLVFTTAKNRDTEMLEVTRVK